MNQEKQIGLRILVVIGTLITSLPAWSQYPPSLGPYRVLTAEPVALHDGARQKDVPVKIYYPEGPGPFPLIIFSHGALASRNSYSEFGRYWASFGYVIIHPSHADSIVDEGFRGTLQEAISDPKAWQNRPKDISFVIDSLPTIEKLVPDLQGKLDRRHIGVGGHSFGAYTSELIGGMVISLPEKDKPQSFADKRVSAILLLSPEGQGRMGLTAHSWDNLRLPMLLMFGSRDFGPWGEPPSWRSEPYRQAPSGDKYEVELLGGTHMGFAGSSNGSGIVSQQLKCAKLESLAFWDAYLKGNVQAKQYLVSHRLQDSNPQTGNFASK